MLNSLKIENFRGIKKLEMSCLGLINLLVGKNNTGKSSILEAVHIYAKKGNPEILEELIAHRDEDWEEVFLEESDIFEDYAESPIRYLFHGYHFPEGGDQGIVIGPVNMENENLNINKVHVKQEESEKGLRQIIVNPEEIDWNSEEISLEQYIQLYYRKESRLTPIFKRRLSKRPRPRKPVPGEEKVQFVPTENIGDFQLSNLWDNIELTNLQKEIVKGLQLIDSRVVDIAMVGGNIRYRQSRIPIVKLIHTDDYDEGERIPLKTLGDGMTRIFHILLALVNSKDGFLLVDEFENGIHWTALPKLWEIVFRVAADLNVQVIATTHSKDCVNSFYSIWEKEQKDKAAFYRLDIKDNEMDAKLLSKEDLEDALEAGVEVR